MKALLWKDVHINRAMLCATAILLAFPYVIAAALQTYWHYRHSHPYEPWSPLLMYTGLWSLGLSILGVTLLAGNAFAGERADRSAEFLASVPVSRRAVLTSKALVLLTAGVLIWLLNLGVIYGFTHGLPTTASYREVWEPDARGAFHVSNPQQAEGVLRDRDEALPLLALTTFLAVGVAWGGSCLARSPALAACAGLGAPIVLGMVFAIVSGALPENSGFRPGPWYALVCLVLGAAGCIGGTCYYLRRVEP
jgi:ABC-type Na+ efflux pump permease subunit